MNSWAGRFSLALRPIAYPDSVVSAVHGGLKQPGCKFPPFTSVSRMADHLSAARANSIHHTPYMSAMHETKDADGIFFETGAMWRDFMSTVE